MYFEIESNGNLLKIEPIKFLYKDSEIDWDKNWILSKIKVLGGQFSGEYYVDLMTIDFESIKQELKSLYNNLSGKFIFKDLENFLKIKINGNGLGKFYVKVKVRDKGWDKLSNKLSYSLEFDQTQITELVNQLELITKVFPITGDFKIKNKYN